MWCAQGRDRSRRVASNKKEGSIFEKDQRSRPAASIKRREENGKGNQGMSPSVPTIQRGKGGKREGKKKRELKQSVNEKRTSPPEGRWKSQEAKA
jgi:hypothetical protein